FVAITNVRMTRATLELHNQPQHLFLRNINVMQTSAIGPALKMRRSGVRSAEPMLADYAPLNKVDSARRCGLYHGRLEKQPQFSLE
ncbi:hypothetical protein MJN69_27470, partial [Salmonella enterica subsp. enterica serovar Kentucky]|nr:hypothetical protein [Salmonella enterica subsp. enterica serovar Kentucky]